MSKNLCLSISPFKILILSKASSAQFYNRFQFLP
jgi:hypothetical protein